MAREMSANVVVASTVQIGGARTADERTERHARLLTAEPFLSVAARAGRSTQQPHTAAVRIYTARPPEATTMHTGARDVVHQLRRLAVEFTDIDRQLDEAVGALTRSDSVNTPSWHRLGPRELEIGTK
jgi:hypothetical protein